MASLLYLVSRDSNETAVFSLGINTREELHPE